MNPSEQEKNALIASGLWKPEDFEDTEEMHACPFAEEIGDNHEPVCHCSKWGQRECAMDI